MGLSAALYGRVLIIMHRQERWRRRRRSERSVVVVGLSRLEINGDVEEEKEVLGGYVG